MPEINVNPPHIGSLWQHRNGNTYRVLAIANIPDEKRYPKTIVYQNANNGTIWALLLIWAHANHARTK